MESLLPGAVALVTGGGRGIGRRLALGLAEAGADVAILARTPSELELAASQIKTMGRRALAIAADQSRGGDTATAVRTCAERLGAPSILVNAGGIQGPIGGFDSLSISEWAEAIEINLLGLAYVTHAVLQYMIPSRRGKILNISGGGAAAGRPFFSAYAASKAAVVRFTETLAEEVKRFNVQVNAIGPGATKTRMTEEVLAAGDRAGAKARSEAEEVWRTGGTPAEKQVSLAVFLSSQQADHITGRFLHVNDPWQELRAGSPLPSDAYTLRRLDPSKVGV